MGKAVLARENVVAGCVANSFEDAIKDCGDMLVKAGYVNEKYIEGMLKREEEFSTAIGNSLAIPHAVMDYKKEIIETGLVIRAYPDGIDWNGENVRLVIGIAAKGDEHLEILEKIANTFEEPETAGELAAKNDPGLIYDLLTMEGSF
ncbi:MAG: PTS sugar transporter subunit IIA [Clostridiales bacterium]|jgi:mannitol/fructose-specific phosphotransferase system IIA component|nr:PTS sugar transporter subunit IIA [Clostridiales bacterium]